MSMDVLMCEYNSHSKQWKHTVLFQICDLNRCHIYTVPGVCVCIYALCVCVCVCMHYMCMCVCVYVCVYIYICSIK